MLLDSFYLILSNSYINAMTQKLLYIIVLISLMLSVCMTGCLQQNKKADSLISQEHEALLQSLGDSLTQAPYAVNSMIDSMLVKEKDSAFYFRLILLKMRIKFVVSEIDSLSQLFHLVESYCKRHEESLHGKELYAYVYNMKGNVYARKALMDSACIHASGRKHKFCYLSLIQDTYSKEIVGWAVGENVQPVTAFMHEIKERKQSPSLWKPGLCT